MLDIEGLEKDGIGMHALPVTTLLDEPNRCSVVVRAEVSEVMLAPTLVCAIIAK